MHWTKLLWLRIALVFIIIYLFTFKNNLKLYGNYVQKDELWASHFRVNLCKNHAITE